MNDALKTHLEAYMEEAGFKLAGFRSVGNDTTEEVFRLVGYQLSVTVIAVRDGEYSLVVRWHLSDPFQEPPLVNWSKTVGVVPGPLIQSETYCEQSYHLVGLYTSVHTVATVCSHITDSLMDVLAEEREK